MNVLFFQVVDLPAIKQDDRDDVIDIHKDVDIVVLSDVEPEGKPEEIRKLSDSQFIICVLHISSYFKLVRSI